LYKLSLRLRSGAEQVLAVDIDLLAREALEANLGLNNLQTDAIQFRQAIINPVFSVNTVNFFPDVIR
jgi:ribosomal protein L11 methylase PrmA